MQQNKPISFIIITYKRLADVLALLQNIASLSQAAELLQEVIVLNNDATDNLPSVQQYIADTPAIPFRFVQANDNLGVTKGRNEALKYATGDICIFLDDDAILENNDALINTIKAFKQNTLQERSTAIVSFKVLYHSNRMFQRNALPHKQFDKYMHLPNFYTYYFAGGAHAIKRKILLDIGGLPEDFFYGMEEYDISYRVIEAGYAIKYDASIVMLHKESPLGRKPNAEKWKMMWVNKCIVAYKYLPIKYFYTTAFMWSFQYLKATKCNVNGWIAALRQITQIPETQVRNKISEKSIQYLKQCEARLWY